ncbi:phage gp6-like head-tail connector protein [Ochrobactrum intermedium]|uniref:head-tail connector protein n=1 Tax=Brucella intermedia TaxID=94625 RepID=UPI00128D791B|nr:head-tail connector protein [Brucella intermedia]MPR61231.1 phage gp6-like head-tail connector protein [Brucella intermedia]
MAVVPLTLAKAHMNIVGSDDDELINHYIDAAEEFIADFTGKPIPAPAPASLKQAILMVVAHWNENREAATVGISAATLPFGVMSILRNHRDYSLGQGE